MASVRREPDRLALCDTSSVNRKTQVAVIAVLALGGSYVLADAFDLTPGLITTRPVADSAQEYPSIEPIGASDPTSPVFDEEVAVPSTQAVSAAITGFVDDSRLKGTHGISWNGIAESGIVQRNHRR